MLRSKSVLPLLSMVICQTWPSALHTLSVLNSQWPNGGVILIFYYHITSYFIFFYLIREEPGGQRREKLKPKFEPRETESRGHAFSHCSNLFPSSFLLLMMMFLRSKPSTEPIFTFWAVFLWPSVHIAAHDAQDANSFLQEYELTQVTGSCYSLCWFAGDRK